MAQRGSMRPHMYATGAGEFALEAEPPLLTEDGPPALVLADQRGLPGEWSLVRCEDARAVAAAIRDMVVRGAPAIGIAAAWGMALAALRGQPEREAAALLLESRPTAVNLRWAVERSLGVRPERRAALALALHREDIAANHAMGEVGAALLPANARVWHHCNTGALATGGHGTALGVIRTAFASGRLSHVWVGETRPWLQGARLTAFELKEDGIPCTLCIDSLAAVQMAAGQVDAVLVGADRVAANGDVANKVGTYGLAVLARAHGVPFFVCAPTSTFDPRCPDGAAIPIEERPSSEVYGWGGARWAAEVPVRNPSFDVTPARLVSAWITERGPWLPPRLRDS